MMLKHAAAYQTAAMGWVQEHPGRWTSYLVRVDRRTKVPTVTQVIWVHPDAPVCCGCLSQVVDLDMASDPMEIICLDPACGARTQLDLDDPDDVEPADDEADDS
jgi:hypothetical protein